MGESQQDCADIFLVRVAGASFRQEALQMACVGDQCDLVLEPDNQYDRNAIKIILRDGQAPGGPDRMLGYIPKENNSALAEAIRAGCTVTSTVESIGRSSPGLPIGAQVRLEVDYSTIR